MASSRSAGEFARLCREGRYTLVAADDFDRFVTVRAGEDVRTLSPLAWWHVCNDPVMGPLYLAEPPPAAPVRPLAELEATGRKPAVTNLRPL